MKQTEILDLLREAAEPECTEDRAIQILTQFKIACEAQDDMRKDAEGDAMAGFDPPMGQCLSAVGQYMDFLEALFFQALHGYRHALPDLFPVFAMICGDYDGRDIFCGVDWSLFQARDNARTASMATA